LRIKLADAFPESRNQIELLQNYCSLINLEQRRTSNTQFIPLNLPGQYIHHCKYNLKLQVPNKRNLNQTLSKQVIWFY